MIASGSISAFPCQRHCRWPCYSPCWSVTRVESLPTRLESRSVRWLLRWENKVSLRGNHSLHATRCEAQLPGCLQLYRRVVQFLPASPSHVLMDPSGHHTHLTARSEPRMCRRIVQAAIGFTCELTPATQSLAVCGKDGVLRFEHALRTRAYPRDRHRALRAMSRARRACGCAQRSAGSRARTLIKR